MLQRWVDRALAITRRDWASSIGPCMLRALCDLGEAPRAARIAGLGGNLRAQLGLLSHLDAAAPIAVHLAYRLLENPAIKKEHVALIPLSHPRVVERATA